MNLFLFLTFFFLMVVYYFYSLGLLQMQVCETPKNHQGNG